MIVKLGDVNIAGPGFSVKETSNTSNLSVSNRSGQVCVSEDAEQRTLGFHVWARGGCDLGLDRAYELAQRIQTELDAANANNGHTVFYKQLDNYHLRRELLGGKIDYTDFELQYSRRRIVSMDVQVTIRSGLILPTIAPQNISGGYWDDNTQNVYGILVTTDSSIFTEIPMDHPTDYSNFAEFAGSNYVRVLVKGRSISGTQYFSGDIAFPRIGNDTDPIGGLVIYRDSGNPITSHINGIFPSTEANASLGWGDPFDPNGQTITFRVNAKGLFDTALV